MKRKIIIAFFAFLSIFSIVSFLAVSTAVDASSTESPSAMTQWVQKVDDQSAKLQGYVDPNKTDGTVFWFEWGTASNDLKYSTEKQKIDSEKNVSTSLQDLDPDTTYYFRIVAQNDGGTVHGAVREFTTEDGSGSADTDNGGVKPVAVTQNASNITTTSANIIGLSVPGGDVDTKGWFEWGRDLEFRGTTEKQDLSGGFQSYDASLDGLAPNTIYYFRSVVENKNGLDRGTILSFRTAPDPVSSQVSNTPKNTSVSSKAVYQAEVDKKITSLCATSCSLNMTDATILGGNLVQFTITVTNKGNRTITGGQIADEISPFMVFTNASDGGQYDKESRKVTWSIGSLGPGESKQVQVVATAEKSSTDVTATGNASFTSVQTSGISNNTTLHITSAAAPIGGSINPGAKTVIPGGVISYTIDYKNQSETDISDVSFRVILPEGMTFAGGNSTPFTEEGGILVYKSGVLKAGEEKTATFQAKVGDTIKNNQELITTMIIDYTNPKTNAHENDTASVATTVQGTSETASGFSGFLGAAAATPFFPNTLVEWLILFLVLVILVLIIRQIYAIFDEKKRQRVARAEAENQMQQMRQRMNGMNSMYGQPYGQMMQQGQQRTYYPNIYGQPNMNPSTNNPMNPGASYYGKSGYGPNGQPVYGPAPASAHQPQPSRNMSGAGRFDAQGNGHTARHDYQGAGHEWGRDYQNQAPSRPQAPGMNGGSQGNGNHASNMPAITPNGNPYVNSQNSGLSAQQKNWQGMGGQQYPFQPYPQNGYGMPYGQQQPMYPYGYGMPQMPYGQPTMPMQPMPQQYGNGYGMPYGQQGQAQQENHVPYLESGYPQEASSQHEEKSSRYPANSSNSSGQNREGNQENRGNSYPGFQGSNLPR
ncbi:MAG TPA: hypothetical protein VFM02_00510 [Candidatus Paceibacterota bacterium]|nr:hypothetical protein [Candidatus Paceibacterota bacterium]